MRVELMLTCLCDAVYGEVGVATVKVLEEAGCTVGFRTGQTCCGQPAFNAGDWGAARPIAERTAALFEFDDTAAPPVVVPSASCVAMIRHGYAMMGVTPPPAKVYELCEFIVEVLERRKWQGKLKPQRVVVHRACHARAALLAGQQETLVASIEGVELVAVDDADQCCGFGGAFSLTHGKTSEGIGLEKLRKLSMAGADLVVSGDMGCIAHLQGLAKRNGIEMRFAHVAQLLAEAVQQ